VTILSVVARRAVEKAKLQKTNPFKEG